MVDWIQVLISFEYTGVFLLGLIGAASVVVPIPTTVALLAIAGLRVFDPTLLALAFGLGAALGQLTSYAVGYVGRKVVSKKYEPRLNALLKFFGRYGMIAVFIFALTPLPDSLLFIPLGLMHYSLRRVFVAAVAGKISMSLIITYVGGAVGEMSAENWIFAAVTTILLILVVIAMFKIDWVKLAERYAPKGKGYKRS